MSRLIEVPGEAADEGCLSLQEACDLCDKWFPDLPVAQRAQRARQLVQRDPLVRKAYRAGLLIARDLRERSQHGLGWPVWAELEPLTPRERGFVMQRIRDEIGLGTKASA